MANMHPGSCAPLIFDRIFIIGGKEYSEDDWKSQFESFGQIKGVFIKKKPDGERKGLAKSLVWNFFGFYEVDRKLMKEKAVCKLCFKEYAYKGMTHIKFSKTSEACLAQEAMNGQQLPNMSRPIKVLMAYNKDSLEMDTEDEDFLHRLFLRIPKSMSRSDLRDTFLPYGDLVWTHILMDKSTGQSRGLAFVKYAKQSQAARALEECDTSFSAKWADVRPVEETRYKSGARGADMGGPASLGAGMMDIIQSKRSDFGGGLGQRASLTDFGSGLGQRASLTDFGSGLGPRASLLGDFNEFVQGYGGGLGGGMGLGGARGMGEGLRDLGLGGGMGLGGARGMGEGLRDLGLLGGMGLGGARGMGEGLRDLGMGGDMGLGGASSGFAEDAFSLPKKPAEPGEPMYYIESRTDVGSDCLQAKIPEGMTLQQVFALFNICPGLASCNLNSRTGVAKLVYESAKCASFAQEKTDGLNYAGHVIKVNIGKISKAKALEETAAELQQTLMKMTMTGNPDPAELTRLVESIQKTTQAMESQGGEDDAEDEDDSDSLEMLPWCTVPLPTRKPLADMDTRIVARLFFVSVPETVSNEMMENAFSRFGNLIKCRFQADKRFGFAHFADKQSADMAKQTLHGESILNNLLKVEYASNPNEGPKNLGDRKRPADW